VDLNKLTNVCVCNSCVRGTDLTLRGKLAEAEGCQHSVIYHGDTTAIAASAAGSAELHQLPEIT